MKQLRTEIIVLQKVESMAIVFHIKNVTELFQFFDNITEVIANFRNISFLGNLIKDNFYSA